MKRRRIQRWGLCLGVLLACASEPGAPVGACPGPLASTITPETLERHMTALADIGAAHGNRAAATEGHRASADYVAAELAAAGLFVRRQQFNYPAFEIEGTPVFAQVAPDAVEYERDKDYRVASFSGSGDVTAPAYVIDLTFGPGNETTSACEAEDFAGFPAGSVALIQRGSCYYSTKLALAAEAGAAAVVLINQGDSEDRSGLFTPRLDPKNTIPAVAVPTALGAALAEGAAAGLTLRIAVEGRVFERTTENVLAETPRIEGGSVIMLGAHLDSVTAGPGINDNGSGSAAILAVAAGLPRCRLRHQVRVAFWGAEELGLLGSAYYVDTLSKDQRAEISMYLNFDMIASPNPVRFVYDGDGSGFDMEGPAGSAEIEAALSGYFTELGLEFRETPFDGRSDYWAFINADIPAGGLFTGAEDRMTADEAVAFDGEADAPYDACYHQACDDRHNYDPEVFLENAQAIAHVTEAFAAAESSAP